MNKIKKMGSTLVRMLFVIGLTAILLLTFLNVVLRYVFDSGLYLSQGISSLLFVWMTFIGAFVLILEDRHVKVESFIKHLPKRIDLARKVFIDLSLLGCFGMLLIGSWKQVGFNMSVTSSDTSLPIATLYAAPFVFALLVLPFLAIRLIKTLKSHLAPRDQ